MSKQTRLLMALKALPTDDFHALERFTTLIANELKSGFRLWMPGERRAFGDFVFSELERLTGLIPVSVSYEKTETLCAYADALIELLLAVVRTPKVPSVPPEKQEAVLKRMRTLINNARTLENAVDCLFNRDREAGPVTQYEIQQLLDTVRPEKDQYRRNVLLRGLLHYSDRLARMTLEAEGEVQTYLAEEMTRLCKSECLSNDEVEALELAADLCAFVLADDLLQILYTLPALGRGNISYFVLTTLVDLKKEIPDGLIDTLAADEEWSFETKSLLEEHDLGDLFPAAYDDMVFLACANLVHWLVYPTELGRRPDEIEYIATALGRTPADTYYIYRFRSDSENLEEGRRGVWLVGWTDGEGHSFSEFDRLSDCERETPEKTASYIRRTFIKTR